jgi:hypothetical protein
LTANRWFLSISGGPDAWLDLSPFLPCLLVFNWIWIRTGHFVINFRLEGVSGIWISMKKENKERDYAQNDFFGPIPFETWKGEICWQCLEFPPIVCACKIWISLCLINNLLAVCYDLKGGSRIYEGRTLPASSSSKKIVNPSLRIQSMNNFKGFELQHTSQSHFRAWIWSGFFMDFGHFQLWVVTCQMDEGRQFCCVLIASALPEHSWKIKRRLKKQMNVTLHESRLRFDQTRFGPNFQIISHKMTSLSVCSSQESTQVQRNGLMNILE